MILPVGDVYNRPGSARTATWSILVANILVYLYELQLWALGGDKALEHFFFKYGTVPAVVTLPAGQSTVTASVPRYMLGQNGHYYLTYAMQTVHVHGPHWLGLFTALFIHGGFLHIAGNMLFFWIFSDNVEDLLGTPAFLLLYFTCGIMANVAQVAIQPHSLSPCIGASGAIAGVLGAYLLLFPWNKVRLFYWFFFIWFGIWEVSAVWVLGFWFVWQLFSQVAISTLPGASAGIAYMAHVGGFITGLILAIVLPRRDVVKEYYKRLAF